LPVEQLLRHPSVTKRSHTASTSTTVVTDPNSGNVVTTTTTITPQASGNAHQTVTTAVVDPLGKPVSSEGHTLVIPAVTGTDNISSSAELLVNATQGGNTNIQASLNTLTHEQIPQQMNSIHAEPYSSNMTIGLEHADMVMNSVLNHASSEGNFSSGRSNLDAAKDTRKRLWMDALYSDGDIDGENGLGDFDYTLSSIIVGGDIVVTDSGGLGAFFAYGEHEMDEHDLVNQDFSADVYHVGLYLNEEGIGRWDIRSVLGAAYSDHSSKRQVALGEISGSNKADFDSYTVYFGVKGSMTAYENSWLTLSPELGFNYTYYNQESITESGVPELSLKIDSGDAQAVITSVGVNALFSSLLESHIVRPLVFTRYEHDWYANSNDDHEIDAALVSNPGFKQSFAGQNRGENTLITGLGLQGDINSDLQISGGLLYSYSNHGEEWGVGFNGEYRW
jgi:outer membrane autotransporter protein